MAIPLITLLAPRLIDLRSVRRFGLWRAFALAALSVLVVPIAGAQTVIGPAQTPDVTVNMSVLHHLGPPQTPDVTVNMNVLDHLGPAPNRHEPAGTPPPAHASRTRHAREPTSRVRHHEVRHTHLRTPHRVVRHEAARLGRKVKATAHGATRRSTRKIASGTPLRLKPPTEETAHSVPVLREATEPAPSSASTQPILTPSTPSHTPMPKLPRSVAVPPPPSVPPAPRHTVASVPDLPATPPHKAAPTKPARAQAANNAKAVPQAQEPQGTARKTAEAKPAPVVQVPAGPSHEPATQPATASTFASALETVRFAPHATVLPANARPVLDAVASQLLANSTLRLELIAHAKDSPGHAMEARRESLARAIAVRTYLIKKGVNSVRMDVRALGNRSESGPPTNQVDLLIVNQ